MVKAKHGMHRVEEPTVYDPYAYHRPHFIRWRGSVISKILPSIIIITVITVAVTVVHQKTNIKLGIDPSFIPVLSFVVGLLLTYRTNTAYDRYWEGRRLWSNMVLAIRNLTRNFWVNIDEDEGTKDVLEKKTAINLLLGFAIATKHYLREEEGSNYEDLKYLISNIESKLPGFEPIADQDTTEKIIKESSLFGRKLSLRKFKTKAKPHQRAKGTPSLVNPNLPLTLTHYLQSYIDTQVRIKGIDVPTATSMYQSLNSMIDCLTNFERILRSPIPMAYSIHLSQTVWIYCLSLPFQLVQRFAYSTIPIVILASLVLMGVEQIGNEIENPFGYDDNDLDLDDFCGLIKRELNTITSNPRQNLDIDAWINSPENHPFGPYDVSGSEASKLSLDEVRSKLSIDKETDKSLDISVQQQDPTQKEKENKNELAK